jgi:hypothetical protein
VVPSVETDPGEQNLVSAVRLHFLTGSACAMVSRLNPGPSTFPVRTMPPDTPALYSSVSAEDQHAIVGQGLDQAGVVQVDGCVDLPGRVVLAQETVRVVLPLRPLRASPAGSYRATSFFQFRQTPKAVEALGATWKELATCPSEPGRLWLDCTVDALGPATADDPHDCRPSTADEAAFDGRLAARRGLPLALAGSRCRGETDGAGRPSLEKQMEQLFVRAGTAVAPLPAIAREADNLLKGSFKIHSSLVVTRTSEPNRYQIDHRLDALELTPMAEPVAVDLLALALPGRTARFVNATAEGSLLQIAEHGFSVRLGTGARIAFEKGSLSRRGFPASIGGFVTAVFGAASHQDRGMTFNGCFALAALVCPLMSEPEGCLAPACLTGLTALGRRLEAAFAAVDGDELDLVLEGAAPIVDRDGDRRAEALGLLLTGNEAPGVWTGQVRPRGERAPLTGAWTADRVP